MLVVELNKKYLIGFKIIMFLISIPFVVDAYEICITGSYVNKYGHEYTPEGPTRGFYSYLIQKIVFAMFFIWLASFGSTVKKH